MNEAQTPAGTHPANAGSSRVDGHRAPAPEAARVAADATADAGSAYGVQIFAGESNAPRDRRSADAFLAGVCLLLLIGLALVADDQFHLDDRWSQLATSAPGWVAAASGLFYFLAGLYLVTLFVGVAFVAHRRHDLLRDLLVAVGGALGTVFLLSYWVSDRAPELSFLTTDLESRTFPAGWLTTLTAVQAAAVPQLSRPVRRIGWAIVGGVAITGLLADITTPRATAGGFLAGLMVVGATLFVFGSSRGRPSLARVTAALTGLGVEVESLTYAEPQPSRSTVVDGTTAGGQNVQAMVLGRDAGQTRYLAEAWRSAWHQDEPWPRTSRRSRVEHGALGSLFARTEGVNTSALVAVGQAGVDDALLVTATPDTLLADTDPAIVDDDVLGDLWAMLRTLHDAGIAHGRFNPSRLTMDSSGLVGVVDFSEARLAADPSHKHQDDTELLVSTALLTDVDRAVDAAERVLGSAGLAATAPYLQTAALTPGLALQVRSNRLSLKKLRKQVAARDGVEDLELEQLHRVSVKQVLMVASMVLAVYLLLGVFADVGLEATVDALRDASIPIALAALFVSQLAELGNAIVVLGASPKPLPFGIVTFQQFSINYVNLVVASSAGRIAVNVRFGQKMGLSAVNSMTLAALASLTGFALQAFWIITLVIGGDWSIDWSQVTLSGTVLKMLVLAVGIGLVFLLVAVFVRHSREWMAARLRGPTTNLRTNLAGLRDPHRLLRLLGGNVVNQLLLAITLLLSAMALGSHVTLVEALFINTVVSLFAGLMPVPGGVGVTEAGLSAGLVAVGVPADSAFAIVLVFRLCTFYLPPIWGGIAMKWLTKRDYL